MKYLTLLLAGSLVALTGCPPKQSFQQDIGTQVTKDGLTVELHLPRRLLVRGETVPVTVVARNLTKDEMVIPATTGALVYVTLWRNTEVGWEQVKQYPESAAQVATPWRLAGTSAQSFPLNLRVAPDWPTGEPLRITAELNGRPEVAPGGIIQVFLTQEECDRAKVF